MMKKTDVNELKISHLVDQPTRKRLSTIVTALALVGMIITFFFIGTSQPFITSFLLAAIFIALVLIVLYQLEKYEAAQKFAVISLWILFALIGISQGSTETSMITGFLMLVIISGYAFYLKGVVWLVAASSLVVAVTGWMELKGIALYKVDFVIPQAKVMIGLLFLLVGASYYVSSLALLGRNYTQVREYQRRYITLFNDSIDAIVILSLDMKVLDMNPTGLNLTGYTLDEITKLNADDFVGDREGFIEIWEELRKHRKVGSFEHQIRAKNGDLIDVESFPSDVTDENGVTLYYQVHMRDVRSRKKVEEHLNDFKKRYEAMFERAEYGFLLLNMGLEIVAANKQAADILNAELSTLHNQPVRQILRAGSFLQLKNDIKKLKRDGELSPRQYRLVTTQGAVLWVEANIGLVKANPNQPQYLQWIMRDITDQKQRESKLLNALQEMETLAMTDPLTGLHNRRSIQRYGQLEMERCSSESKPFCVILIDVDFLKQINDTHGHQVGDQALSQCGQMLIQGKRRDDAVGRWGGDEFLMVLPNTSLNDAEIVAHRILKKILQVKIGSDSQLQTLTVSMGLAGSELFLDNEDLEFESLVGKADQSMYDAKFHRGRHISVAQSNPSN